MHHIFIAIFLIFSASSLPSFGLDITEEVEKILDQGKKTKKIFILKENTKRKQSHFFEFNFRIPEYIDEDPLLVQKLLDCMRATIQKNDLVGPERRPLSLIPYKRREITNKRDVDDDVYYSAPLNCGKDFDFGGPNRRVGGV